MARRILVAEDEPINLEALTEILTDAGYEVEAVGNAGAAWHALSSEPARFDLVLLDRMMPDMDGIEVLRRMKQRPEMLHLPVIMQTSLGGDEAVAEGLKAGAYYYLTKPFAADTLLAIVGAAIQDFQDYRDLERSARRTGQALICLAHARFEFRTPDEARDISTLIAQVAPDPGRVVLGLSELTLNAVEHGNLGLSYEDKSRLGVGEPLVAEIARRLAMPEFSARRATIEFRRTAGELVFVIRDEGSGFDWRRYLEMSPERAFDTHGRGIAMSRMLSFDRLEYHGCGNEVEAAVLLAGQRG